MLIRPRLLIPLVIFDPEGGYRASSLIIRTECGSCGEQGYFDEILSYQVFAWVSKAIGLDDKIGSKALVLGGNQFGSSPDRVTRE
jgi:hypothetical protein